MSLTSYRAAPPRDKPCALSKDCRNGSGQRHQASINSVRRLPEKANPWRTPSGAEAMYQCMPALKRPVKALLKIKSRWNQRNRALMGETRLLTALLQRSRIARPHGWTEYGPLGRAIGGSGQQEAAVHGNDAA